MTLLDALVALCLLGLILILAQLIVLNKKIRKINADLDMARQVLVLGGMYWALSSLFKKKSPDEKSD